MDAAYRKELQSILKVRKVTLPQVFIKGKYIGGADVIKSMFEMGELAKNLDDFPRRQPGFVCNSCGDVRFVPCGNCNESRKLFEDDEVFVKRCFECNENGLIRCPYCCD
ncbi:Detected protein of confused Function [Hibiscus syriacus]|uniref:Detected protein of confused Function n=1 Tax=Hibiscus syriacus TaxID=106335 RepID=A0A6A2YD36_HIBSY|nr:Detected protein of confused Function [Hibiscus syriacus]